MIDDAKHPSRPHFIIDALTGEILKSWDGLTSRNATGPGGNLKTGQYVYGKDYGFLNCDQMRSPRMETFDHKFSDIQQLLLNGMSISLKCEIWKNFLDMMAPVYSENNGIHCGRAKKLDGSTISMNAVVSRRGG